MDRSTCAPRLIVMCGLPGTGKSAIADGIASVARLPVLSVDPIESAILAAGVAQSFETGLAAYLVAESLAEAFLGAGLTPIVDAVNEVEPARSMWERLAERRQVPLVVIECVLGDAVLHRRRLHVRERGLASGEPGWSAVERQRAGWTPWDRAALTLDAADPLDENVFRALAHVHAASPLPG